MRRSDPSDLMGFATFSSTVNTSARLSARAAKDAGASFGPIVGKDALPRRRETSPRETSPRETQGRDLRPDAANSRDAKSLQPEQGGAPSAKAPVQEGQGREAQARERVPRPSDASRKADGAKAEPRRATDTVKPVSQDKSPGKPDDAPHAQADGAGNSAIADAPGGASSAKPASKSADSPGGAGATKADAGALLLGAATASDAQNQVPALTSTDGSAAGIASIAALAGPLGLDPGRGIEAATSPGIEAIGDGQTAAHEAAAQQPDAPQPVAEAEGVDSDAAKIAKASLPGADAAARLAEAVKLVAAQAPKSEPDAAPSLAAPKLPDVVDPQSQGAPAGASPAPSASSSQHAASDTRQVQHPVADNVPLGAVPIEVGLRAMAGLRRFEIRLDPPELGRIDVRLDMSDDGHVKAHLTVDRIETLALLQRDARTLERAFEQAGLKPSDGGVDLTLRDQNAGGHPGHGGTDTSGERAFSAQSLPHAVEPDDPFAMTRLIWRGRTGLDLRV